MQPDVAVDCIFSFPARPVFRFAQLFFNQRFLFLASRCNLLFFYGDFFLRLFHCCFDLYLLDGFFLLNFFFGLCFVYRFEHCVE
ncbi:MAG TPA: hypothetical protein ENH13_05100 [Euryarchaeota archaeon]|nr:hypothetical protein [Euryarchaeota archaeon]